MSEELKTVTIYEDDYKELLDDYKFLKALRKAGVDNWEGYDYAVELDRIFILLEEWTKRGFNGHCTYVCIGEL